MQLGNKYILLDVLLCSIAEYFCELCCGRVKIQTTSKNSQRYYTTKRLIRDLLSNTPNCYVRAGEFRGYLFTPFFFVTSIQFVARAFRENLFNWSSGEQIPRNICTRFGRYLYSTKCSWIINPVISPHEQRAWNWQNNRPRLIYQYSNVAPLECKYRMIFVLVLIII